MAGRAAGRAAMLLLIGSPFYMAVSGSAMNHASAALALTAAALCLMPIGPVRSPHRLRWIAVAGGLCLGWAVTIRPLTGLVHALVWAAVWVGMMIRAQGAERKAKLWCGHHACKKQSAKDEKRDLSPHDDLKSAIRNPQSAIVWVCVGLILPAAIFLFYNWKTTGHPLHMGYQANNPAMHRLGFRAEGPYPYMPLDAIHNLVANLMSLGTILFGWAIGSVVVLAIWWTRTRLSRGERILAALCVAQTVAYTLYHFHDLFMGPRFLYEIVPFLAVLAAMGLAPLLRSGGRRAGVVWLLVAMFALGGVGHGLDFWCNKYAGAVNMHDRLDRFVHSLGPRLDRPTAIVVPKPFDEMVGRYFPAPRRAEPVWFVVKDREADARRLPELRDAQWIVFQ